MLLSQVSFVVRLQGERLVCHNRRTVISIDGCYLRLIAEELNELCKSDGPSLVVFEEFLGYLDNGPQRVSSSRVLDMGRDWQLIPFLIGRGSELLLGGSVLGEVDYGYGPVRYLTPDQVQSVWKVLASVTKSALRSQFQPARLDADKVYPGGWSLCYDEPFLSLEFERLWVGFEGLATFFREASSANDYILCWQM